MSTRLLRYPSAGTTPSPGITSCAPKIDSVFLTPGTALVDSKYIFNGPWSFAELASTVPNKLRRAVAATDNLLNSLNFQRGSLLALGGLNLFGLIHAIHVIIFWAISQYYAYSLSILDMLSLYHV